MRRTWLVLVLLATCLAIGVVAAYSWIWVSGGSATPSTPITAPRLRPANDSPEPGKTVPVNEPPKTSSSKPSAKSPRTTALQGANTTASGQQLYRVTPEESEVRYIIDEIKRGQPTTVVGTTNQIAGDILIDSNNPSASKVGTLRINVRTLRTDEERRDRATRSRILQSAQAEYEFVEFSPTDIGGLPAAIELGVPIALEINGQLTVRDITHPVSFKTTVTLVSAQRLEGHAVTTIRRSDYDLVIPSVPFIADVSDDVRLEIDFVATLANSG